MITPNVYMTAILHCTVTVECRSFDVETVIDLSQLEKYPAITLDSVVTGRCRRRRMGSCRAMPGVSRHIFCLEIDSTTVDHASCRKADNSDHINLTQLEAVVTRFNLTITPRFKTLRFLLTCLQYSAGFGRCEKTSDTDRAGLTDCA